MEQTDPRLATLVAAVQAGASYRSIAVGVIERVGRESLQRYPR